MTQNQNTVQLNIRSWWQRRSIRTKLLIPVIIALVAALIILLARVIPPISSLADSGLRDALSERVTSLGERLTDFLVNAREQVVRYATEPNMVGMVAKASTDASSQPVLNAYLNGKISDGVLPYVSMQYVDRNGQQLSRVIAGANGATQIQPKLVTYGNPEALQTILAMPVEHAYVLPVSLSLPDESPQPIPVIQIGIPVYNFDQSVAALIVSLDARGFFQETLQPLLNSENYGATLLDQNDKAVVTADPKSQSIVFFGDPTLDRLNAVVPLQLADGTRHDMISTNQGVYSSIPLNQHEDIIHIPWTLVLGIDQATAYASTNSVIGTLIGTLLILFVIAFAGIAIVSRSVTHPLVQVSQAAKTLASGDLQSHVPVAGNDEIGQVATALNTMRTRLSELFTTLESRVTERTRNIEIAAEISRDAAQQRDIDQLLQRTVNAIRERFDFYHAQVFLIDDIGQYAVLITSTGEAGQELLARKHKLEVGSNSVVGQVTEKGRVFITLDTEKSDVPHRFNPLLPKTRSEMALPLRLAGKVIGALDIQSVEPNAFQESDVQIFQLLADQIAIAIDNARLFEESERRLEQVDALNRQLTQATWTEFIQEEKPETLGFQYDLSNIMPITEPTGNGDLMVDIKVRGETVGQLSVRENVEGKLSDEEKNIVEAVADRVALAIENARLVEQTRVALAKIERLYQASRTLGGAIDLEDVFRIVADYLSSFETLDRLVVLLARPEPVPGPQYFDYAYVWNRTEMGTDPLSRTGRVESKVVPVDRLLPDLKVTRIANLDADLAGYFTLQDALRALGIQSLVTAPISTSNLWFGMMLCQSRHVHGFTPNFVQFVSAMADQIAIALDNRRLFEDAEAEARRNRALAEAAQISSQIGIDFETGLSNLFHAVAGPADYDRWWFGQYNYPDNDGELQRIISHFEEGSPLHHMARIAVNSEQNAIAEAARLGQLVVVNDPTENYSLAGMARDKARAFGKHIAVPVHVGTEIVGALMVGRGVNEAEIDERDVQLVVTLANQIAVVIENRRLFLSGETERQTLQAVLNSLPTGVAVVDAQSGRMVLTNQLARKQLGLDEPTPYRRIDQNGVARDIDTDFPPNQVLKTLEPIRAQDMTLVKPNGDRIEMIVNAAPVTNQEGKLISAVAVFQDVTELRELENVLQDSLRETTSLYELSRAIAAENELPSILGVVVSQMFGIVSPKCIYAIFRDDQDNTTQMFTVSMEDPSEVLPFDGLVPVPTFILQDGDPFTESDIAANPELASDPKIAALDITAIASFAFNVRGRAIGWLVMGFDVSKAITPEERRFLSTLTDQAAVALEGARLSEQTNQALSETTLLYEAGYELNRVGSIEEAIQIIRDQLKFYGPSQIDVFLAVSRREATSVDWIMHWDANDPDTEVTIKLEEAKPVEVEFADELMTPGAFFIENPSVASDEALAVWKRLPGSEKIISQSSVPLSVSGRVIGRLIISFHRTYRFGRAERQFITTLADQAGIVINNNMLVQQTQESLEETGTLYVASRGIADAINSQGVLNSIIEHAAPPVIALAVLIKLIGEQWDDPEASIEIDAQWRRSGPTDLTGSRFSPGQFPLWPEAPFTDLLWIESVATDAQLTPEARSFCKQVGVTSIVMVPLNMSGKPIGALLLGSDDLWEHTERETRIYTSLADQVAISVENRNLLAQAERRTRQLQASAQVAQAATSILNLNELFDRTVNLIKDTFQYDHVQIFLISPDGTDAQLVASTGEAGQQLLSIRHHLGVGSASVIGRVTASGEAHIVVDTNDPRAVHKPNPYLRNTRSELALPLKARDQILGALDVQSNLPGAFSKEDEGVLSNLADQIAVAIDNARLFEFSNRRVEEMQFLFDVTSTATVEEIDIALQKVSQLVVDNLKASASLVLVIDDTGTNLKPYTAAVEGVELPPIDSVDASTGLFKALSTEKQPIIANNIALTAPRLKDLLPGMGSAVLLPMLSGENFVGALGAMKIERNGFSDESIRLLTTLSSTLAAIIQNAQLLRQVQNANLRLREVDKLKSQFLANMSHELRTPLNSIIGFSRVILKGIDGPLSPMQEQDLSTIHESGKHLLNLVNDILDQAKIEAGKMELAYGFFSMGELVKSVMSTAVGLVKDKPVRLHQEIEQNLPQVWGDEFRSRQVLLNLVSNASKFTSQGSVTVSAFRVHEDDKEMVQVSVTDTGIGIPEDKIDAIFEAFQQAENTTARQYEGTGLGLPIAKSLIEMQGGRIWVTSEPSVGSTFNFTIPTTQPDPEPQPEAQAAADGTPVAPELEQQVSQAIEQAETPKLVQRIILAIDDELGMVNLYRRYLAKSGYEVIGGRAEEAEELAINYQPRVILLDVNMPNRSGWDVLQHLKDRDETFEIPVIICSIESDKEQAFRLGAADYLVKSIDERTLIDTIKRVELERDRRKILIIDDQPESIRLIRDALTADERFAVLEAVGGAQGLDVIQSRWPDLVILDLRMPEMDGFEVLDRLHSDPATSHIPVLVVTAGDLTEEERQRLANACVYQKQEINAEELLNNVVSQLTW